MPWVFVFFAGLFEICWVMALRYSEGFTRLWPSLAVAVAMIASVSMAAQAARVLPVGTVYAMWTGIGAIGIVTLSIFLFGESSHPARLMFIGMIFVGILGLRITSPT